MIPLRGPFLMYPIASPMLVHPFLCYQKSYSFFLWCIQCILLRETDPQIKLKHWGKAFPAAWWVAISLAPRRDFSGRAGAAGCRLKTGVPQMTKMEAFWLGIGWGYLWKCMGTRPEQSDCFCRFLGIYVWILKKNSIAAFPTGYIQYWFIFWRCTDGVGHGVGSIFGAPKMGYVGYVSLKMDKKK